jgi:hypothetical protein
MLRGNEMKNVILGAILAAGMGVPLANAATLDFYAEATSGAGEGGTERGIADGTTLSGATMDNVAVKFSATYLGDAAGAVAYFDNGAGLGVCKVLTPSSQCDPSNDDNVTFGEAVTIAFNAAMDLSNLIFRAEGHGVFAPANLTLLFGVNGATPTSISFADLSAASFTNVTSATFAFGGTAEEQFYISSAVVGPSTIAPPIPLPAGAPLLLSALGALGFGAWRRRKSVA